MESGNITREFSAESLQDSSRYSAQFSEDLYKTSRYTLNFLGSVPGMNNGNIRKKSTFL